MDGNLCSVWLHLPFSLLEDGYPRFSWWRIIKIQCLFHLLSRLVRLLDSWDTQGHPHYTYFVILFNTSIITKRIHYVFSTVTIILQPITPNALDKLHFRESNQKPIRVGFKFFYFYSGYDICETSVLSNQ